MITRRQLSKNVLAGGAALLASKDLLTGSGAFAAQIPERPAPQAGDSGARREFDLLIKGGTVIDPGQGLNGPFDVAIRDAKIAQVSADIPQEQAQRTISAKGRIVTPGWIDIHVHCYDGAVDQGTDADHFCLSRGVTTVVDAGTSSFQTIDNFRRYLISSSRCRIYVLINIDGAGLADFFRRKHDPDLILLGANPEVAAKAVRENRPVTVGIKTLLAQDIEGNRDVELLTRAVRAAAESSTPVLAHIDDPYSPLPALLNVMRKGDVYSHCYNNRPHGILDANGKVIPEVWEARKRGIIFDPAHGVSHFSFDTAEKALAQGFLPDTISTDLNASNIHGPVYDLPTTVSKFLLLGMALDKAIECVTSKPASIFDYGVKIGTLKPGYEADVGIFEMRSGDFELVDSYRKSRIGHKMLINKTVVCRGELLENQLY